AVEALVDAWAGDLIAGGRLSTARHDDAVTEPERQHGGPLRHLGRVAARDGIRHQMRGFTAEEIDEARARVVLEDLLPDMSAHRPPILSREEVGRFERRPRRRHRVRARLRADRRGPRRSSYSPPRSRHLT